VFGRTFSHYLSYGATDQQTVRDLAGHYDGLLVPGTVAAFQREGTGGFVLTLSATEAAPEYVIDPRFPLFQQALPQAKKSHEELASVLGEPGLVSDAQPQPTDFDDTMIEEIAQHWVDFNLGYRSATSGKFDKYARRLNEPVTPSAAKDPLLILAPYACVSGIRDPWWDLSKRLYAATNTRSASAATVRVVSTTSVEALAGCLDDVRDDQVAVWVSALEELTSPERSLAAYLQAIATATDSGKELFALYGGFFSVLASAAGLVGACHGIGYGEYRNWIELPQSGPPPARYYLPQVHRYVSQELAYQLWLEDRALAECDCAQCEGQPPIALEYHSLMKHSVHCRSAEIDEWVGLAPAAMVARLTDERTGFLRRLHRTDLSDYTIASGERSAAHLSVWEQALTEALVG
jgi:hypothetical protein